jgi:hypothetical protein
MNEYRSIDPILSQWAISNSVTWLTDYQGTEVRTFFFNPESWERIQISVDPPHGSRTTVRAGQNLRGLSRLNRVEKFPCSETDLPDALNRALEVAKDWSG